MNLPLIIPVDPFDNVCFKSLAENDATPPAVRRFPAAWTYPLPSPVAAIPATAAFIHKEYVADGSNLTCLSGKDSPDLAIFLNVVALALRHNCAVAAFFDSDIGDVLEKHRPDQAPAYFELIHAFGEWFKQVRPRKRADEPVLAAAEARRAIVISNDTFRKPSWYAKCFPWIMHPTRRLEVHRAGRNILRIGSRDYVERRNVPEFMQEIRATLSNKRSGLRRAG